MMEKSQSSKAANGSLSLDPLAATLAELSGKSQQFVIQDTTSDPPKNVSWVGEGKDSIPDEGDNEQDEDDPVSNFATGVGVGKKKKKKRKSKSKKGANAPTGFEEYYVDAPVTPAEFVEEQDVYSSSKPFFVRIQTAIERYTNKRRFEEVRANVFNKYLTYGGIKTGPKQFTGGLDEQTLEDATAGEIAAIRATSHVADDKEQSADSEHVVDFDGVIKGFFSSYLPQKFSLERETEVKSHVNVILNFLNYILHHDVCPEYKDQINAARTTCALAVRELFSITQARNALPGDFNIACSNIFGGFYQDANCIGQEWAKDLDTDKGMTDAEATRTFMAGLAAHGNDDQIAKYTKHVQKKKTRVVETIETGLEIVRIDRANKEVQDMYANSSMAGLRVLGRFAAKTWYNPFNPPEDITEEEEADPDFMTPTFHYYDIWLEDEVLTHLLVGMKLDARIKKLSFGVDYLDGFSGVYCSFYTLLPNEEMLGWREHRYLPPRASMRSALEVVEGSKSMDGDKDKDMDIPGAEADEAGAEHEGGEDI